MLDLSKASGLFTIYYFCIGCFTLRFLGFVKVSTIKVPCTNYRIDA